MNELLDPRQDDDTVLTQINLMLTRKQKSKIDFILMNDEDLKGMRLDELVSNIIKKTLGL